MRNDNDVSAAPIPLVLGVFAAVSAVADWAAVAWRRRAVEYVCKPLVMVLLTLVVVWPGVSAYPPGARWWFVAALLCSLAGDVFLMLPPAGQFELGLASFLVGHLCYMAGFAVMGVSWARVAVAGVVLAGLGAVVGRRVLGGVGSSSRLRVPVAAYMTVISLMAALAVGTGRWGAVVGAALFYESDAMIAWNRFVRPWPWAKVAIIVTYHAAQALLVLSLVAG
jgi:uncharacterized membrane protein YhhN